MSQWEPLLPTGLPPEIQTVLNNASNAVTQLQNLVQVLSDPLQVALQFLASDVNPALSLLQSVLQVSRSLLMPLGDTSLYWLTLHPWTPMAGSVGDLNPYLLELPTPRFLELLEESINDAGDLQRPTGSGVLVTLAIGANDPMGFVEGLRSLGNLLDLQEILSLANRVEAVHAIDQSTTENPITPLPPDWNNAGRLHALIPPLGTLILQADSLLESFETSTPGAQAAVMTLENTINKKLAMLQKANEALAQMQQALQQNWGNLHLLNHSGAFTGAFSGSTGYPDYKYNAAVSLAGSAPDLQPLLLLLKGSS